jgi:hypothetical protein
MLLVPFLFIELFVYTVTASDYTYLYGNVVSSLHYNSSLQAVEHQAINKIVSFVININDSVKIDTIHKRVSLLCVILLS